MTGTKAKGGRDYHDIFDTQYYKWSAVPDALLRVMKIEAQEGKFEAS